MSGKAAGHMLVARRQAVVKLFPRTAAIIATQDLCLGTAGLCRHVTAKFNRVVRPSSHRSITRPRSRTVFRRAEKNSLRCTGMVDHRNRISSPHAVFAFGPIFSAVVGLVGAEPRAREQSLQKTGMPCHPVDISIHSPVFMLAHFIRH